MFNVGFTHKFYQQRNLNQCMLKYKQNEVLKEIVMSYKILFLDIDGTILKPDHTYTEKTKEAIKQVQAKGIEVFFATGRPLHELEDLAKELGIESGIGYNGGFAKYKGEVIVNDAFHPALVSEIRDLAKQLGNELIFYTIGTNYLSKTEDPKMKFFVNLFTMKQNEQLPDDFTKDVYGISAIKVLPEHVSYYEKFEELYMSPVNVAGLENAYDLIQKKINKGTAVKKVLDALNISADEAIAFGDGMNDLDMLQFVGHSFAMANGNPKIFEYAKYKTTSVQEDGIYNGLKKLGLLD